ncbi:MAG TPA: pyridoxal-dependent decarboxylase [Thermoleophilaceae bacterium]|nr:pyridoxal-dependent decarboxylase [Thermoleophilaceae bacterium]
MAQRPEPVRDLDWSPERATELGESVVALWGELLGRLRELPVNREFDQGEIRQALLMEVPDEPLAPAALLEHLRELAFKQSMYPGHPGFFGYVSGAGTVPGAAADLIASALNQNVGGWRLSPGASEIELGLTGWLAAQLGMPAGAAGHVVPGGAMATLVGLKVARDVRAGAEVRERGLRDSPPITIYASTEAHVVVQRAADTIGIGSQAVRTVPVDELYRMRFDLLEEALERDLADGALPIAVVGTAGTTGTGSIDPLPEIAELCRRHRIWFHVDAAYGGPAALAEDLRPLLAGIEQADSVAIDPHKWLYTPLPGGCVLVRDMELLAGSFASEASYIWMAEEARRGIDLAMLGPQFTRGFDALRVWVSLLAHGRAAYARRISHDAALARYLGELVEEHPDFELMTPVSLSICCFRYAPEELRADDEALDRLNERIMTAIHVDGRTYCSNAVLDGRFCLRACIVNFRTEAEDMETLLAVAAELGGRLRS